MLGTLKIVPEPIQRDTVTPCDKREQSNRLQKNGNRAQNSEAMTHTRDEDNWNILTLIGVTNNLFLPWPTPE
jgi:hypothetical protein